jgi:CrcB protein
MQAMLLIGFGGLLGANARYLVSIWAAGRFGVGFPFGTFVINVSGSLAVGLLLSLLSAQFDGAPDVRLLLATGFLGAYTTFSTFTYETIALLREAQTRLAVVNAVGSAFLGIASCSLGVLLGDLIAGWLG